LHYLMTTDGQTADTIDYSASSGLVSETYFHTITGEQVVLGTSVASNVPYISSLKVKDDEGTVIIEGTNLDISYSDYFGMMIGFTESLNPLFVPTDERDDTDPKGDILGFVDNQYDPSIVMWETDQTSFDDYKTENILATNSEIDFVEEFDFTEEMFVADTLKKAQTVENSDLGYDLDAISVAGGFKFVGGGFEMSKTGGQYLNFDLGDMDNPSWDKLDEADFEVAISADWDDTTNAAPSELMTYTASTSFASGDELLTELLKLRFESQYTKDDTVASSDLLPNIAFTSQGTEAATGMRITFDDVDSLGGEVILDILDYDDQTSAFALYAVNEDAVDASDWVTLVAAINANIALDVDTVI